MCNSFFHPTQFRWIVFGAAFLMFLANGSNLSAQDDLETLRQQMRVLQQKLDEQIKKNAPADNKRVISIGTEDPFQTSPEITIRNRQKIELRVYDLSDIFSVTPQYHAYAENQLFGRSHAVFQQQIAANARSTSSGGGGFGGGGGGVFSVRSGMPSRQDSNAGQRVTMEELMDALVESVSPDNWDENGGDCRISRIGNSLVINCYPSMHSQIQDLIDLFRKKWGSLRTVSINAYWCWLSNDQLRELLAKEQLNNGVGVVNQDAWKEFLENQTETIAYSAAISSHNGQTVFALSGTEIPCVVDLHQDVSIGQINTTVLGDDFDNDRDANIEVSDPVITYRPVFNTVQEGATLQLTPRVTRGGKNVVLDIHSRVNEIEKAENQAAENVEAADANSPEKILRLIDRPQITTHRISTTVRVPNEQVSLVGGMTFNGIPNDEKPHLYLFVKANIYQVELDEEALEEIAPEKE